MIELEQTNQASPPDYSLTVQKICDIFANIEDMIFILNYTNNPSEMKILEVNSITCSRLGYSREELLKMPPEGIAQPVSTQAFPEATGHLEKGVQSNTEINYITRSGKMIQAEVYSWRLKLDSEDVVLSIAKDITDRKLAEKKQIDDNNELKAALDKLKQTQEQLIQSGKLAAIGQLAAGIAHEINNPLGYIVSNVDTSRNYFSTLQDICGIVKQIIIAGPSLSEESLRKALQELGESMSANRIDTIENDMADLYDDVRDGLERIRKIAASLKNFSHMDHRDGREKYDLNEGIRETLLVAHNEALHHADVTEELGQIPLIYANGSQINQVLLNIILNAVYAIRSKAPGYRGKIRIKTYYQSSNVFCEIEDNGTGIEKENLDMLFNPFFTTKRAGEGTGLGLSIAYDIIVNRHSGDIRVESTPGKGAKFVIRLSCTGSPDF